MTGKISIFTLNFVPEQPYAIKDAKKWSVIKKDAETMCEYIPKVFVIDGTKFKLNKSANPMTGWKTINNFHGVTVP